MKGACGAIIVLWYNYCPIDQSWHKSLLQIISGQLSGNYEVSIRYVFCWGVLFKIDYKLLSQIVLTSSANHPVSLFLCPLLSPVINLHTHALLILTYSFIVVCQSEECGAFSV